MKECTHCGGPNALENRVCDYCGMGFSEDTIPEGSVDPRETAKREAEAMKEALREKNLFEFNLDSSEDQNITINTPFGEKIVINDPVEKASSLMGSLLTGAAAVSSSLSSNRRPPKPPRPQPAAMKSSGCGVLTILASCGMLLFLALLGLWMLAVM